MSRCGDMVYISFDMSLYPCLRLGHTAKGQSPWTQRGHVRPLAVGALESQTPSDQPPLPM